ncbi:Sec-independent protein translocase protein TatB [Halomonas cupida]|uniref:Sec-independent protein translocase protein TatB n=1 Tax=Halomonas cupida TaxID=44933 RepID=A0A1M7M8F6_9GAMM|nr:Sec-independent protein translocase protein TatB [Halomonas cupida]GEN25709.1 sec-independent protein translocase protein TatB [Halomonas cupida]SHM87044.1 sec-independent protein translocase protein TatB [Halomonas cupida]
MLDIGFLELLLVGVVGLLVLGPERLPRAARTAGLWIGRIKRSVSGIQREITSQLEAEELRQKLKEQQSKLDDSVKRARQGVESLGDSGKPTGAGTRSDNDASTSGEADADSSPVSSSSPASSASDSAFRAQPNSPDTSSPDRDSATR